MTARGQRRALGLLAGALAVAAAVALTGRYALRAEWWQVEHRVAAAPSVPLSDLGPSPGPLTVTWSRATPVHRGRLPGYSRVAYGLVHGQVVTVSGHGLDVRDARTGAARWSYRRSGWVLLGWAATGDRLAAYFEPDEGRDRRLMIGFDARTGRRLWQREGDEPAALARATLRWPAGSGVVVTTGGDRRTLRGRSAATGERLWRIPLRDGCVLSDSAAHASAADETLVVVTLACPGEGREQRHRLLAVDPGDGRVRWERPLGSSGPREVAVHGSVTLVSDDTTLYAYTRDGHRLLARHGEDVCGDDVCPAAVAGDRLVVVWDHGRRIEAVEIPTGRTRWDRAAPGYLALTAAGGRVFGLRPRLAEGLLPAGVDAIDPGDGRTTTAATGLVVDPGLDGAVPWLAAAGGLLYVAAPQATPRPGGGARLAALHGGPSGRGTPELGGVPVEDWPDACSLLRPADLDATRLAGYRSRPGRVTIGHLTPEDPVSCAYEPGLSLYPEDAGESVLPAAEADPREVTVGVKWVATDAASASALLGALRDTQTQVRPRAGLGDEAYELGPTSGTIALRVGRHIIGVYASRPTGTATQVARAVAANLRTARP
ncbi:outer membrane protein assembly factor BamB family protein [Thermomonospora cellulosilytica]|uniref:Outer membrane protein assembly factor BamB n=1 Tax=Thermomonospora cellulosilytica TaxID=1411118 RepID=A0A7W3RCE0_9ACTN|nr:PQQ-binding-like beta-propeller repeat protein [Thermomonospora cellulosilytica]MBA9007967.1 outer membrane protein assembly factor BamB [Thermomonospora cellulosilytica]